MPHVSMAHGRLAYTWNGVADGGPAFVLIHGAGGQARDWPQEWRFAMNGAQTLGVRALPEAFAMRDRPVYALDLPGHGQSDPIETVTLAAYATVIAQWIEAVELTAPIVIGHSMGGGIALTLALDHPDSIGGVGVIGSAAQMPVTDQILDGLQSDFDATVDMIVKFSWPREAVAVYRETGRRHMKACGPAAVHADFVACANYSVKDRLADITHPALVIAGEKDKMVPMKAAERLVEGLPDATLSVVPNAGHFLHFDAPGRVGRTLAAWANTRFPRT